MTDPGTAQGDLPSLGELVDAHGAIRPDATYLHSVRTVDELTYGELRSGVAAAPARLEALGVAGGATLGLLVAEPLAFARCFLAAIASGAHVVPLDPTVPDESIPHLIEGAPRKLDAVVSDRAAPHGAPMAWIGAADLCAAGELAAPRPVDHEGSVVLSSSGTTGAPKVVSLSARQLVATAVQVSTALVLTPQDRAFNSLPLWHVNAEVVALLAALSAGSSVALDTRFHRTDFWAVVERCEATWVNAVPAIIARLATREPGETIPERVRLVRSASSPLSPVIQARFEAVTGVPVVQSYGMTEAASQICANPPGPGRKPGSVGPPIGVELRIAALDPNAEARGEGVVGHVEIKGPTVITHYEVAGYEDRFDAEGWLRTGDLGYVDSDGYLFLVGRSDDVINRSGEKIYPHEIEDVIHSVAGVHTVAVVGESDDVYGEVPVAYLQLEGVDESTELKEVEAACGRIEAALESSLPRVRRPARLLVSAALPAHAVGKVSSSALRRSDVAVLYRHDVA